MATSNGNDAIVVSFGEMLIDFVPTVAGVSLAEAPAFVKAPGGAPANVSIAVSRLGGPSAFVGKLGDDDFGRMLAGVLEDNGVSVAGLRFDGFARTALSFVTLRADGEREFMFYRHPSADMLLSPVELDLDLIRKAAIFHFGSISLIAEPCRSAHWTAMQEAKKAGALLSYDPNLRLVLWPSAEEAKSQMMSIWDQANIVKISDTELEFLTGKSSVEDDVIMSLWRPAMKLLVVTLGKDGCKYYSKDFRGAIDSIKVNPVDTTGAGDAFVGAMLWGIAKDLSTLKDEKKLKVLLRFANACGAITTTKKGAVPAMPHEAEMAEDPEQQIPNRRQKRRTGRSGHNYGPPPPELHPGIAHLRGIHRAAHPDLNIVLETSSHLRMSREWPIRCPRFSNGLRMLGLDCVTQLQYIRLDQHLLTALVERWSPKTNSFHLPVGEMSITLQDVAMILGVNVDGPALIGGVMIGEGKRWQSWPDCCNELLGEHPEDDRVYHDPTDPDIQSTFQMGQAKTKTCVPLRWLRWMFCRESYAELTEVEFQRHLRAYVLYILGCFLLPDTSGSEVHLQYLPLLEHLELFCTYSLGGAVLAHLYRELCEATRPIRVRIAGCLHLLQIWSWEHLHIGRPTLHRPYPSALDGLSVGVRWNAEYVREMPPVNVKMYRDEFDGLVDSQVIWQPYNNEIEDRVAELCLAGREIWRSRAPLICWKRVEWHLPERVLRQFGIPPTTEVLPMDPTFERKDGRGKADIDWVEFHQKFIAHWEDRRSFVMSAAADNIGNEPARKIYMRWYRSWASLYLLSLPNEPPTTYYPKAPIDREYRAYILEVEQLFKPFYGLAVNNPYQAAINQYEKKTTTLRQRLHIVDDDHDEEVEDPCFSALASHIPATHEPATEAGPSSFHEEAPNSNQRHHTMLFDSPAALELGRYQDQHWDVTIEVNEEPMQEEHEEAFEDIPQHELRQRPLRAPTTYTPGSDAIPRQGRTRRR